MSKKAIYHGFDNEYKVKIIDYLSKNHGWLPSLIIGNKVEPIKKWMEDNYPSCIFQETIKLRQAQFDYTKIGKPVPIDIDITNRLAKYELNYMGMIGTAQDATGYNYSFEERKSYYFDILKYWNTVICHIRPDILILFTQPHTPTCNSLYLICKHYYNIDVLFIDPVSLLEQYYHMIGISLDELHAPIMKLYNSSEKLEISQSTKEYLDSLRGEHPKIPGYILECHKYFDQNSPIFRFKPFIRLLLTTLIKGTGFNITTDWKKNQKPYHLLQSRMNDIEHFIFREKLRNNNKKLRKYYDPLCVKPDYKRKYLYFAASYQPEANTATNAGIYESFLLALDILSYVIPDDWIIYYKENPTIFRSSPSNKGFMKRDKCFYERINKFGNIQFVSSDINTFMLIDNSQAVATVSGTAAWEAVNRGKPALSFGNAWYMGCKSIFWVKTLDDARNAIKKIVNDYKPDLNDIERYAASIEKVALKGMIHRNFNEEIKKSQNPEYELQRIAKALYTAYERHYS